MADYNKDLESEVVKLQELLEDSRTSQEHDAHILEVCMRLLSNLLLNEIRDDIRLANRRISGHKDPHNIINRFLRLVRNDIQSMHHCRRDSKNPEVELEAFIYERLNYILQEECMPTRTNEKFYEI